MTAPEIYVEIVEAIQVDTPLLIPCPKCGGTVVRRRSVVSDEVLAARLPVPEVLLCRDCGHFLGAQTQYGPWVRHTEERVSRRSCPLRAITEIDRGNDGEGMAIHLECGHQVRLQRRAYRFSQKRLRCVRCSSEEST